LAAQQRTVDDLAAEQRTTAVESRATADALLGMTRPMDESRYSYAGALLGSGAALAGGQYSGRGVTLIGGVAFGAEDYPGVEQDNAATIALAGRYTFEHAFPEYLRTLRPYAEIGGWVTPREKTLHSADPMIRAVVRPRAKPKLMQLPGPAIAGRSRPASHHGGFGQIEPTRAARQMW
jgi:hypothetical protein